MSAVRAVARRWCVALAGLWLAGLGLGGALPARAHESLPASLIVDEHAPRQFEVRWRIPQLQGVAPAVTPRFPADCTPAGAPVALQAPGARLWHWSLHCAAGLQGPVRIGFDGLALAGIDVVVRLDWLDGRSETRIARPREPEVRLGAEAAPSLAVSGYFGLGVAHILGGVDHLLFVLCLVLLVPGRWALLRTITAFTLAHSLTLALAALQVVRVPQPPVEAMIALSILFLARELALRRRDGAEPPASVRRPWAVAFAFGLLHGFGFAGALAEIGLPQDAVAPALLLFNLGVEAGQLLFVAALLPLLALASRLGQGGPRAATMLPVYAVGTVAGFWWVQRLGAVVGLAP